MKIPFRVFCLVCCVLGGAHQAIAAEYAYYPAFLRLGAGIDPKSPLEPLPYCFDFKTAAIEGIAVSSTFSTSLLTSRRDLLRELGISASISGRYQFFGGGIAASYDQSYQFAADSVTWMVKANTDYGRRQIVGEKLLSEFDTLRQTSPSEFASRCGTELVTEERKSATVAAIFSVRHLSEAQQQRLSVSFNAGVSTGVFDAKVAVGFRSFVAEAARSSAVKLDVVVVGGAGASALSGLFTDFGDLDKITAVLRQYAQGLSLDTAATTSFLTTSMRRYGWTGESLNQSAMDLALGDYYLRYRDADALRQRITDLLTSDQGGAAQLSPIQRQALSNTSNKAEALMYALIEEASKCRSSDSLCSRVSGFPLPAVQWPNLDVVRSATVTRNDVTCEPAPIPILVPGSQINYLCNQSSVVSLVLKPKLLKALSMISAGGTPINYTQNGDTDLKGWVDTRASSSERRQEIASDLAAEQMSYDDLATSGLVVRDILVRIPFGSAVANPKAIPVSLKISVNSDLPDAMTRDVIFQ